MPSNNNAGAFIAIAAIVLLMLLAAGCVIFAAAGLFFVRSAPRPVAPPIPAAAAAVSRGLPIEISSPGAGKEELHTAVVDALRLTDAGALPDGCVVVSRDGASTVYLKMPPSGVDDSLLKSRQQIAEAMQEHLPAEATLEIGSRFPETVHLDAWGAELRTNIEVHIDSDKSRQFGLSASDISQKITASGLTEEGDAVAVEQLRQLPIETPDGNTIALEQVAEFTLQTKPAALISEW